MSQSYTDEDDSREGEITADEDTFRNLFHKYYQKGLHREICHMTLAYQDITRSPVFSREDRPNVTAADLYTSSFERVFKSWSTSIQSTAISHPY